VSGTAERGEAADDGATGSTETASAAGRAGAPSSATPARPAAAPEAASTAADEAVAPSARGAAVVSPTVSAGEPLASDMLTPDETLRAEQLVIESALVQSLVAQATDRDEVLEAASTEADAEERAQAVAATADKPSYRIIYAQRHPEKGAEGRAAEVAIYRYDTGAFALSKVDLETGEVEALEVPEGMPVPIVPEEIDEAAAIARGDGAVRERLTAAGLDPNGAVANALLTVGEGDDAPCARHRCLRLFFSSLRQPVPVFSVVVDMVTLSVVETADMPGEGQNP